MTKLILLCLLAVIVSHSPCAQGILCPEIPAKYGWEKAEDYFHDREHVKMVLKWLCKTPYGENIQQRSVANAYVMEWLAGTPEITINVSTSVILGLEENPDILFSLIHGMALHLMEHPNETDPVKLHTKGLETVAILCNQSKELSGDSRIKPLLKAYRRGRIREYTAEKLSGTK